MHISSGKNVFPQSWLSSSAYGGYSEKISRISALEIWQPYFPRFNEITQIRIISPRKSVSCSTATRLNILHNTQVEYFLILFNLHRHSV